MTSDAGDASVGRRTGEVASDTGGNGQGGDSDGDAATAKGVPSAPTEVGPATSWTPNANCARRPLGVTLDRLGVCGPVAPARGRNGDAVTVGVRAVATAAAGVRNVVEAPRS